MHTLSSPIIPADAVDDAAAYLRLDGEDELLLISGLIASAIRQCEAFCATILLRRAVVEQLRISGDWQLLGAVPVRSITSVAGLMPDGSPAAIGITRYALDIDPGGGGWFRVIEAGSGIYARVTYQAGLAETWADIDAPLRQGIIRLVAYLHANRDSSDDTGPPAAVAALWRPYRRMRLTSRRVI